MISTFIYSYFTGFNEIRTFILVISTFIDSYSTVFHGIRSIPNYIVEVDMERMCLSLNEFLLGNFL